jgi:hypothetical protein
VNDHFELVAVNDARAWRALFSRVEQPHLTQTWAYGDAKQASGGWRAQRFVFVRSDEPVAICQVLDRTVAGVRLASRLNRGPLFLDPGPSEDLVAGVYGALRRRWRGLHRTLFLAPALDDRPQNHRLLSDLGFHDRKRNGWCSARLDLRQPEAALRSNLTSRWRNRLKAAERSGLDLRIGGSAADLEWMIARHVENMAQKGFVGPKPALLRALHRAAPGSLLVFRAHHDGAPVGGLAVYRFGGIAECYIGWFGPEGRKVNVGNFLFWQIALDMSSRGCYGLDVGGLEPSDRGNHFGRFKGGLGATDYMLANEWLSY